MANTPTCNKCKQKFVLDASCIKLRQDTDVLFRYMQCPICGTAFFIDAIDKNYKRLQRDNTLTREEKQDVLDALSKRHIPRFRELFPNAYFEGDEEE